MPANHLPVITYSLLLASSLIIAVASTPSFPDMTCSGSESGTCTANNGYCFYACAPGDAPFFTIGLADETKCHSNPASRRGTINETMIDIDMLSTQINPRQPQGTFVQNTGLTLPKDHCIVSCDRTHINYNVCAWSGAAAALLNPLMSTGMALIGAALFWVG